MAGIGLLSAALSTVLATWRAARAEQRREYEAARRHSQAMAKLQHELVTYRETAARQEREDTGRHLLERADDDRVLAEQLHTWYVEARQELERVRQALEQCRHDRAETLGELRASQRQVDECDERAAGQAGEIAELRVHVEGLYESLRQARIRTRRDTPSDTDPPGDGA